MPFSLILVRVSKKWNFRVIYGRVLKQNEKHMWKAADSYIIQHKISYVLKENLTYALEK